MSTTRITQIDIDLAKLLRRAADRLGERVEPDIQALADAQPTAANAAPESWQQHGSNTATVDDVASNMCGVTLMNNQVGAVVARVMRGKANVTVLSQPSLIRVDAVGRMDFEYDEISDALGEEPGYFDAAELEENMSTHYGRMIHLDDRTILLAHAEDAAKYRGFDLAERSTARSGSSPLADR